VIAEMQDCYTPGWQQARLKPVTDVSKSDDSSDSDFMLLVQIQSSHVNTSSR